MIGDHRRHKKSDEEIQILQIMIGRPVCSYRSAFRVRPDGLKGDSGVIYKLKATSVYRDRHTC